MVFQVLSRNNDINGNPYRLVLVYATDGRIVEAYEARASSPNILGELRRKGYVQLVSFHLAPQEYNDTRAIVKDRLQHAN